MWALHANAIRTQSAYEKGEILLLLGHEVKNPVTLAEYIEEIYQTYLQSTKEELSAAAITLREMTPAPMNSMLEKQPREEAIEKKAKRMKMTVEDVPPTSTPGTEFLLFTNLE